MSFDGSDDYVNATLDISETAYAAAMWFKADSDDRGMFAAHVAPLSGECDRHLYLTNGNMGARTWNNEVITTSGLNLADGQWHHVVHTFGGTEGGQKLYIDGILAASGGKANSDFDWQTSITIGFSNDGAIDYFEGLIDEVYIYDKALTAADAAAMSGVQAVDMSNTNLEVTDDSVLNVRALDPVSFGDVTMKGGSLTTTGAGTTM